MKRIHKIALMLAASLSAAASAVNYTYDAVGRLTQADYGNGNTITYTYDSSGNLLSRTTTATAAVPSFTAAAVVNAASLKAGPVAPGEMVTIFGSGIGPATPSGDPMSNGIVSRKLAGTRVLFDGVAALIYYVSSQQCSVVVPYEVAGKGSTELVVEYGGIRSRPVMLPVAALAPGLFTSAHGSGQGAIVNQDGSLNASSNPAPKGSVVLLYLTGAGRHNLQEERRQAARNTQTASVEVSVAIGGVSAQVQYTGTTPHSAADLTPLKVVVPANAPSGAAVPVMVTVGGVASQRGVTLAIQ